MCFTKWSRESRIYDIPINKSPKTCEDLLDLFPGLKMKPSLSSSSSFFVSPPFDSIRFDSSCVLTMDFVWFADEDLPLSLIDLDLERTAINIQWFVLRYKGTSHITDPESLSFSFSFFPPFKRSNNLFKKTISND